MEPKKKTDDILIRDYLDGTISVEEFSELESRLLSDSQTRSRLRTMATIEEGILDYAATGESLGTPGKPEPIVVSVPAERPNTWLPWSIAVAACIALVLTNLPKNIDQPTPEEVPSEQFNIAVGENEDQTSEIKPAYVARLVDALDARFADAEFDHQKGLTPGDYFLEQGYIHIRFQNGADMVLQSPARFTIMDDENLVLHDGKLHANFPPTARDFRVSTPGVVYHDLETEFGITANSELMTSEVHVFQGRVNSVVLGEIENLQTINSGQAIIYRNGQLESGVVDKSPFLVPGAIGFRRWQAAQPKFRNQQGLIGYFPFYQTLSGALQNHAVAKVDWHGDVMPSAQVGAATWGRGRWREKQGLLFETARDNVRVQVPGEFSELSFAVWVKLDRLNYSHNALLNTDHWAVNGIHWQLSRSGRCWISGYESGETEYFKTVPTGRWVHLAATLSTESGLGETYMNGELISRTKLPKDFSITPQEFTLGNWFNTKSETRAICGRVDELMIWDRCVDVDEIKKLVEIGRPSALWGLN